jgi:hypothetical protein
MCQSSILCREHKDAASNAAVVSPKFQLLLACIVPQILIHQTNASYEPSLKFFEVTDKGD